MTVTYLPPMRGHGPARPGDALLMEALTEGPMYARSGRSTRWHLVRSAVDVLHTWDGEIHRHVDYWCGQTAARGLLAADAPPDGEPTCGTCYGRREGWNPDRPELLFSPRVNPPKVCPGSRSEMFRESTQHRRVQCLICGEHVKCSGGGGPYNPTWGMQVHGPGAGLVDPCDFHGWRDLVKALDDADQTVIACRCRTREVPR